MFGVVVVAVVGGLLPATVPVAAAEPTGYSAAVLADLPLAYLRLDDPEPSTEAVDSSGHGHNAAVGSGTVFGGPGALPGGDGSAVDLGWSSSALSLDLGVPLSQPDRSLEMWVGTRVGDWWNAEFTVGGSWAGFTARVGSRAVVVNSNADWNNSLRFDAGRDLGVGAWHHVVVSAAGDSVSVFIDGVQAGPAQTMVGGLPVGVGTDVVVGGSGRLLDEFAVYDKALGQTDVSEHFGATGYSVPVAPVSVQAVSSADNSAEVSWIAGGDSPEPAAARVGFVVSAVREGQLWMRRHVAASEASTVLTGLEPGEYIFEVSAVNGFGVSAAAPSDPVTVSGATGTYSSEVRGDGPSRWWRFGEQGTNLFADSSGSDSDIGCHADQENQTGWSTNVSSSALLGDPDGALRDFGMFCEGSLSGMGVPESGEAWLGPFATVNIGPIEVQRFGSSVTVQFNYDSETVLSAVTAPSTGAWVHVAVSVESGLAKLYLDGELAAEGQVGDWVQPDDSSDGGVEVTGLIDELALYDSALDAGEVVAHFAASGRTADPSAAASVAAQHRVGGGVDVVWSADGSAHGFLVSALAGTEKVASVLVDGGSTAVTLRDAASADRVEVVAVGDGVRSAASSVPVSGSGSSTGGYGAAVLGDDPASWLRFEDTAAFDLVSDSVGLGGLFSMLAAGPDGSDFGVELTDDAAVADGAGGRSIHLWSTDDDSGAAVFGAVPSFDATAWTWEGWVRGDPAAEFGASYGGVADLDSGFSIDAAGFELFGHAEIEADVLDDTWHHVAVTNSVTAGVYTATVYVDGESVGSMSEDGAPPSGTLLADGRSSLFTARGSVHLDEVALYDHALSGQQVAAHFNSAGYGTATDTVIPAGQQIRPGSDDRLTVEVSPELSPVGEVWIAESGSSTEIGRATLDAGAASVELDYLPSGVADLVAIYEPAGNQFAASQSAAVPVTINRAVSALDLEVADPAPSDEPVILGVGVDTVAPNPTGLVTVTVGETTLPGVEMTAGDNAVVQVDLGVLNPGTHDIEVDYEGDDNVEGSDDTGQVNVIAPVMITAGTPPAFTVWQQGEWSVEVESGDVNVTGTPQGHVVAHGPNVVSGAVELDDGVALVPVTFTSAGSSDVSFEYLPPVGSLFAGAETDPQSVTAAKGTATIEVESDGSPSGEGFDVTFTATVTDSGGDGVPSGDVRFTSSIDAVSVDRPIIGGVATWTTSELTAGEHDITAEYLGDDDYEQGATGSVSQVIDAVADVTLSVDPASTPVGEAVTFTVQVDASDGSGVPVGSVTLWEAMLPISLPAAVNGAGEATISHVFSAAGDHHVTARYSADGYQGQTAAPTTVEVTRRDSPVTVQVEPTVFGEQPVVQVTSGDLSGLDAPSSVTVTVDGEAPVSFALDDNGAGSFTLPTDGLDVGVNQITVEHDADDRWNSYTETVDLAVAKAATRISGSTEDLLIIPTSSATIDFEVAPVAPGDGSPAGTVQAHVAGNPVGNPVAVSTGEVVLSAAALGGLGVHDVDLTYSGDDNFEGDTTGESERVRVVVAKDVTITSTVLTPSPSDLGAEVTVNVDVSDPAGGGTPGGTVALFDGERTVAVADLANGTAALRTRLLHAGTRNLSVHYSGDTVFAPAVSTGFSHDVNMGSTDDMVLDAVPGVVVEDRPLVLRARLDGTGYVPDGGVQPGGEVKFFDATGTEVGVGPVDSNGVAVWRIPAGLSEGSHSFTATYAGDANYHNDPVDTGDVTVDVLAELTFNASLSDDVIIAGDTVTGSIANPDTDIDQVTWYWGDGTSDVNTDPTAPLVHDYVTPGLYTVTVHAADTDPATARSNWERFELRVIGDETPQADPGGRRIVEVGEVVRFDGSISRPAFGFDHTSFEWDLGDGTTSTDTVIEHTYDTAGTYDVELTATPVIAALGGPSTGSTTVKVVPAAARVTFDVTTGSGGAVDGAVIVVNDQQFGRWETVSDSQGTATLKGLADGSYTAYVLANGYQAKAVTFQVTDGTADVAVELAAGAVGGIEITHRPISAEEAAQYGIDLSDPTNQQIVRFEIHIPNQTSQVIYVPGPGSPLEPFGPGCPDSSCGHVRVPGGGEIPVPRQVDPVMAWLIIPGEARFTKQFFELSAIITNTSSTEFTFTDGTATLDLPAGLSLAPTGDPQDPDVTVADIPGGGTETVSWIIRGDTAGEFYPSVDYTATLSPVGQPIRIVGTAQTPLRVVGIESLKMTVDIDDSATYLSPLPVTVTLTNTSDTTLDNPKLDFADQIVGGRWAPRQQLLWAQRTLAPQESLTADLVVVPAGDSTFDLKRAFVKWLSGVQEGTDEFNGRAPYVASTLTTAESAPYGKVILDWDGPPGPYRVFTAAGDDNFGWQPVTTGVSGGHTILDAAPGERALYAITTSESLRGQMVHNAVWATGGSASTTTVTGNDSTCSEGGTQTVTVSYADEFGLVTQWRIRDAAGVVLASDTISDPSGAGSVNIDVPAGAKDIQFANNTDWDSTGNPVWSHAESIAGCAGWNPAERRGPDTQTVSFDADPVNTLTGAESHVEADLAPYAALAGLGWGRTYDSGGVGGNPAWGFAYSDTLEEQTDGSVIYTNDRTRETTFSPDGSGGFNPAPGEGGELSTAGTGWELAYPDGSKVVFDADGLVSSKVFADGQIVTTTRGTGGRLLASREVVEVARRSPRWGGPSRDPW
jgi:hypothetical protein